MLNIEVNPRNPAYRAAKKATGMDDEALVQAALAAGLEALAGNVPNAITARAIKSKAKRKAMTPAEFMGWVDKNVPVRS